MLEKNNNPLVQVIALKKYFFDKRGIFLESNNCKKAVDGVSFEINKGEVLGLVGESGCGKTTLGRTILHLYKPTSGKVIFDGMQLANLHPRVIRRLRARVQMIFQDPYASLNPQATIGKIISFPLIVHQYGTISEIKNRVSELLELCALSPSILNRYPEELSGGQCQRVGIARALALNPDFIVCDEPIASLDVSIQAQIINLLVELKDRLGLTYLFISHDLSVVRHISDRIAVMYAGKIVEISDSKTFYNLPVHPYSQALISAIPVPSRIYVDQSPKIYLKDSETSSIYNNLGCMLSKRCPFANGECLAKEPTLREVAYNHWVACHRKALGI